MESLLFMILSMSLSASVAAAVVLLVRLFFRRIPKVFSYVLWTVVLFRMLCPFTFTSNISIVPSFNKIIAVPTQVVTTNVAPILQHTQKPQATKQIVSAVIPNQVTLSSGINQGTTSLAAPTASQMASNANMIAEATGDAPVALMDVLGAIWLIGLTAMLGYAARSYVRMKKRVADATRLEGNLFESDHIRSPFVLGIFKPSVYLPVGISADGLIHIIAHERAHIRRGDHIIRLVFWAALAVHWFNPIMWLCFVLMARDMELSCDEYVLRNAPEDIRIQYSESMLALTVSRSGLLPTAFAFGESNVKKRIKNVLCYKKPAFMVMAVAVLVVAILSAMLFTDSIRFDPLGKAASASAETTIRIDPSELTAADLLPPEKVARIGDWVYYVPSDNPYYEEIFYAYSHTVYRMRADGSDNEALFCTDSGSGMHGNDGVHGLTQCGDYLLFTHASSIYKMDVNTLHTAVLVQAQNEETSFSFAVDGRTVYFCGINKYADYTGGIYAMEIDGTNPKQITFLPNDYFAQLQICNERVYAINQFGKLSCFYLDGSNAEPLPLPLAGNVRDFIVYEKQVVGRSLEGTLFRIDLDGNSAIALANACSAYIIADGKIIYSQAPFDGNGIFMCDMDGTNHKRIYEGPAKIIGGHDGKISIYSTVGGYQLHRIVGGKESKAGTIDTWPESTIAFVYSGDEFMAAMLDERIETIQIASSMALPDSYYIDGSAGKHTLIISEDAVLTIPCSCFDAECLCFDRWCFDLVFVDCNIINNGELIVAGCVMCSGGAFTGNGKISCMNGGSIRFTCYTAPTIGMLKKLLSADSPYTDIYIDLPVLDEPKLVLTEDLEIAQGKTLSITKGDHKHVLVVPKGITLINNGTLSLLELKVEGNYEGQPPLYIDQA